MGLAIGLGMLVEFAQSNPAAARQMKADLRHINTVLTEAGLPAHQEPERFDPPLSLRATLTSFPYSWLHHLRRFAAHVMRDPKWVPYPIEPGEDPADDPVLRQMYRRLSSHLLCHSDSEGYYLPLDFDELFLDAGHKIRGGVLGSSQRLFRELLEISDPLEIPVDDDGKLSDEAVQNLSEQRPAGAPFAVERLVWLALFESARVSIERQTAIVFY